MFCAATVVQWYTLQSSQQLIRGMWWVAGQSSSSQCFLCEGNTCDNGCGTSGFQGWLVPDQLPGVFDFATGCCNHDHCWSSSLARRDCDAGFYRDNIAGAVPYYRCYLASAHTINNPEGHEAHYHFQRRTCTGAYRRMQRLRLL